MRKTKAILALLVILAMILAVVPFSVFANNTDKANIQLNGVLNCINDGSVYLLSFDTEKTKTVETTVSNTTTNSLSADNKMLTVDAGSQITFKFSQAGSMMIDGSNVNLDANNSYTYTAVAKDGNAPTIMDFNFGNQQQPGPNQGQQPDVQNPKRIDFDNATVANDGKVTFNVDGTSINATLSGTFTMDGKTAIVNADQLNSFKVKLDNNFKSNEMTAYVMDKDQRIEMGVSGDNEVTFADANIQNDNIHFGIEKKQQQPGPDQGQQEDNHQAGGPDNIEFDVKVTDSEVNVWINNKVVLSDENGTPKSEFKGTITEAGVNDESKTNQIKVVTPFGSREIKEYVINGVTYKQGDASVQVGDPDWTITVPGAKKYVITARGEGQADRTIIWTNPGYVAKDAADAEWIKEFSLEHGNAYIKAVYDKDGKLIDPSEYVSKNWDKSEINKGVGKDHFGWVTIKPGSKVVFEFVPEYGYQLTDIQINGQAIGAGNKINEFDFIMPDTNIHFDAVFTKTSDKLKAKTNKIAGGDVSLGDNTLNGGSAQLTVSDVELSSDKIKGFEGAAGEYKISNYLNIDLYQVFFKGKNDENDVWQNKIDELNNEVTVTLKLAEGVNANDIVIVHNIHDGETYEIIKIDSYDPETNTITFRTKSFSNYAIAAKETVAKTEEKKEENKTNPATGDNIILFVVIFAVAATAVIIFAKFSRKNIKEDKKQ